MATVEGMIAMLLGVLGVLALIYLIYFSYKALQVKKTRIASGEKEAALMPVKKCGLTIGLVVYFVLSASLFTFKTIFANVNRFGDEIVMSVNSPSMASVLSTNTHVKESGHDEKIYQYDLVAFTPIEKTSIAKYDVILFQIDNVWIVHRIVGIDEEGRYITQGDANPKPDEWKVSAENIKGKFARTIPFFSFINYVAYTPGFYVAWVAAGLCLGSSIVFEILDNRVSKDAKMQLEHDI